MSITTSTRQMTAKEQMAFDLGVKSERNRILLEINNLNETLDSDGRYIFSDKIFVNKTELLKICG